MNNVDITFIINVVGPMQLLNEQKLTQSVHYTQLTLPPNHPG